MTGTYDPYVGLFKPDEPTPEYVVIYKGSEAREQRGRGQTGVDYVPAWKFYTFPDEASLLNWLTHEKERTYGGEGPTRIFQVSGEVDVKLRMELNLI